MSNAPLIELLTALADDELILGHRDAEWTGYAPILEEDIAFSNIAQDEVGHSLVWYSLLEPITRRTPDAMGFERPATDFRCCRFVAYPKGDFAYTLVRQYLFDEAEQVRLNMFATSTDESLRRASEKILPEEGYHLLHSAGLVERLGDATEESHRRMQSAVDAAFPQALGLFEVLKHEDDLIASGIYPGQSVMQAEWLERVSRHLRAASLSVPVGPDGTPTCAADTGGRRGEHTPDLKQVIDDLQSVYQSEPGATW